MLGFASKKKLERKKCSAVRVECLLLGFASKHKASKASKEERADGFRIGVRVECLILGFASKHNATPQKLQRQRKKVQRGRCHVCGGRGGGNRAFLPFGRCRDLTRNPRARRSEQSAVKEHSIGE